MNDFKEYLIKNNIDFENVKNKLEIEALWNELILIKFSSKVKINEKNLREKIKNNSKFLKSYLLSEISFEVSNLKNLEDKFIEISNVINIKVLILRHSNIVCLQHLVLEVNWIGLMKTHLTKILN